jgi:hypothetical protein
VKGSIILILFWDYKLLFGESKKNHKRGQSKWLIATRKKKKKKKKKDKLNFGMHLATN